jgi:hypothetical protein
LYPNSRCKGEKKKENPWRANQVTKAKRGKASKEGSSMEVDANSEKHVEEIFDLGSDAVTSDVLNSFQDYIADGFDSLEEYIRSSFPGMEPSALKMLLAVEQLHNLMQESGKKTSKKLEKQFKESVFFVPEELALCALQKSEKIESKDLKAEDEKLDQELHALRGNIASTRAACEQLQSEVQSLDAEMRTCDVHRVQAIPDALGTDKENFSNDAVAVNKAGKELSSMLPKLQELSKKFGNTKLNSSQDILDQVDSEIQKRKQSQAGQTLKEMCNLLNT